ncbi:hypothetical protein BM613_13520 [Sulfoacidibacillus thermotolerans]|uniref:Helicase HerA central domain-containing protein n=2 Tax=Sulfoacidibacillus thermotolerans TaxID=1765684 RepID=A0A2U3D0S5_SULT2|nr:hypothetical protein BM613_13520 [Sulfoacidibacillus thermotolerans]
MPPPPLRRNPNLQDDASRSSQKEDARGTWSERLKSFQFGEIQTKPDWMKEENPLDRMKNFRFGETKTKPFWCKNEPSRKEQSFAWTQIIPFMNEEYKEADRLPSKLVQGTEVVAFRFQKNENGKIVIYVGCEETKRNQLKKNLHEEIMHIDLQEVSEPTSYPTKSLHRYGIVGGMLNLDGSLEAVLSALESGSYLEVKFEQRPAYEFMQSLTGKGEARDGGDFFQTAKKIAHALNPFDAETITAAGGTPFSGKRSSSSSSKEKTSLSPEEKDRLARIQKRKNENTTYYRVKIHMGVKDENAHVYEKIAVNLNRQFEKEHRFVLDQGKGKESDWLWSEEELSRLIRLPNMKKEKMQKLIVGMKPGEQTLDDDQLTKGIAVGRLIHPVKPPRLVKIPKQQFLRHFFMGGKNGSGKSSTAIQMIQSMLDDWVESPDQAPGFTYVDPAGSTLTIVLNRLLHMEQQGNHIPWEKVHYIDLTPESEFPVGLNLLYHTPGEDYAAVAGGVLDVIKSAYGGDAVFTERLIENGVMTLLYDRRVEHTILGLTSVLQYPAMRENIDILDPLVQEFWDMTGEDLKPKSLDPLLNRLRPLLQKPAMRRIFGQTRWMLNIREWMDEGHIILINTLNLEPKNVGLVGGQVLMRYHITAKSRPADISKPHILMIDEAHLVQIPILEKVIAEDRKFGLSLGLITQFPEQFNGILLKSITENMGTFLTCTLGPSSANAMVEMMNYSFEPTTLQGLPTGRVAAYTSINGEPFSLMVKSDPPVIYLRNGEVAVYEDVAQMTEAQNWALAKAKELSARDGAHRGKVDQEIDEYFAYLRSFRPTDEEEKETPTKKPTKAKAKGYQPTEDELPLLEILVEMAREVGTWEGKTSELLEQLADDAAEEDFLDIGIVAFGKLLGRAKDWLAEKGVQIEKERVRDGTVWRIEVR